MKLIKIGNKKIGEDIKEFVFDGCHKIYLIDSEETRKDFLSKGWVESDFHKLEETNLEECYFNSCPLRFISYGVNRDYEWLIPQCREKATFTYEDIGGNKIKHIVDFRADKVFIG